MTPGPNAHLVAAGAPEGVGEDDVSPGEGEVDDEEVGDGELLSESEVDGDGDGDPDISLPEGDGEADGEGEAEASSGDVVVDGEGADEANGAGDGAGAALTLVLFTPSAESVLWYDVVARPTFTGDVFRSLADGDFLLACSPVARWCSG